jgi:hypothetical protein
MIISFISKFKLYFLLLFVVFVGISQIFSYIFIIFTILQLWRHSKLVIDINFIFLFIFLAAFDLSTNTGGLVGRLGSIMLPISFYIMGKSLVKQITGEYQIIALLFSFIFIFNIIPIVSYFYNLISFGFDFSNLRLLGKGSQSISFTNYASYFAYNFSLFPLVLYSTRNKSDKIIKRNGVALSILAIFLIGSIGQRTGFFILLISLLIFIIFKIVNFSRVSISNFFFIGIFIFVGLSLVNFDFVYESTIYERLFVLDSDKGILKSRSEIWEIGLEEFFNRPDGDIYFSGFEGGYRYAHNLWLDVGLRSGYIVLSLLTISTVLYLTNLAALLKNTFLLETKMIFLFLSTAIFSTFMVEPIMEGYTLFFCSYAFVYGVLRGARFLPIIGK